MIVRLLDSTKVVTLFGQRLSAERTSITVSKTAFLNDGRIDGRDKSSDIVDVEILYQKGLISIDDDGTLIASYAELQQLIENGYVGSGGGSVLPFDGVPAATLVVGTPGGSPGTSARYARGDHQHAVGAPTMAEDVRYDDTVEPPLTGAADVQAALDYFKTHSSGGHEIIVDGAVLPQEPSLYFKGVEGEDEPIDGYSIVTFPRRVTTVQRNAIAAPFAGYTVFDTDLLRLATYDGTAWRLL